MYKSLSYSESIYEVKSGTPLICRGYSFSDKSKTEKLIRIIRCLSFELKQKGITNYFYPVYRASSLSLF